ncbi:maleylpyruvate isomerase family mycothiol-dependent enzyme [Spirilliplanes yamanashiensis]|uniref:Mycothiol-dependent maleylpyruvate isomerase metal-binding domain-containing protein n=1 Tax=Spirilliplanes yamanashiensis TaxID=42233 RepID=A0A8J3Y8V1_9ACTN|nr:maleylpyruvate isomerase family mycothiol-dependent enzyme [Spirilliplanes yamanashiensis]MDP9816885.1 uncharacterized protein (TIGR03083 family) [Spirilliplanes yamanashiensis]GIJ03459.1 hypothetical protein Sya03_28110 [Spirilliplanes yamanashiensis]
MHHDEIWRVIDEQRAQTAAFLGALSAEQWEAPSLCAGWRVRDVAAHLTLAHLGWGPALRELARARGSFDRMIRDTAIRQARLPVGAYGELLTAMIGSRRLAPGVTPVEPMLDVIVHGQDMALPLGITRPVPPAAAAVAATRAYTRSFPFFARRRLAGLRLVATDHEWTVGDGRTVEGPMGALLLLVTGRSAAVAQLRGPGVAALR